ncbi:hypothetical protein J3P80_06270 [Pseudomonas sp. D2-30]|uniref:hypothetical protein n=1 Tax=unclassified Pseudomonas TaxID=196821 RepID=UPI003DA9BD1A
MTFAENAGRSGEPCPAESAPQKLAGKMPWQVAENLVDGFLECKKLFYFFRLNFLFHFLRPGLPLSKQPTGIPFWLGSYLPSICSQLPKTSRTESLRYGL